MFCKKCGATINSGEKFCTNCGTSVEEVVSTEKTSIPVQPPVYPQAPMMPQPKKKKDLTFIIIVIIIGLGLIILPIMMSGDEKEVEKADIYSNSTYNTNNYSNSNNYYENNSDDNVFGQSVTLDNYTFILPSQSEVEIDDGTLTFDYLRDEFDFGFISIQEGTYEELKTSKSMLQQYLQIEAEEEFSVGNVDIATYNGVEFITLPVTQGFMSMVFGFAKLSDTEIVMVVIMSIDEETYNIKTDYTLFNEMATIIKTAERVGATGL